MRCRAEPYHVSPMRREFEGKENHEQYDIGFSNCWRAMGTQTKDCRESRISLLLEWHM